MGPMLLNSRFVEGSFVKFVFSKYIQFQYDRYNLDDTRYDAGISVFFVLLSF